MADMLKNRLVNLHRNLDAPDDIRADLNELADLIETKHIGDDIKGVGEMKNYLHHLLFEAYPSLLENNDYNVDLCLRLKEECEKREIIPSPQQKPSKLK